MTSEDLQTAIIHANEMAKECHKASERYDILHEHLRTLLIIQGMRALHGEPDHD